MGKRGQLLGKLPRHPKRTRQGKLPAWKHLSSSLSKPVAIATVSWVRRLPRDTLCLALNLATISWAACLPDRPKSRWSGSPPPHPRREIPPLLGPRPPPPPSHETTTVPQISAASIWPQLPRLAQPRQRSVARLPSTLASAPLRRGAPTARGSSGRGEEVRWREGETRSLGG
jgi:hypothetical protein